MKQLTCELCGSTNIIKKDGAFVCEGCGTKYTVEEAKKMLAESPDLPSESKAIVDKEPPRQAVNYMELAERALDGNNYSEAESYCNRVLEMDPQDAWALLYKGAAAAWQSTFAHLRLTECVASWQTALSFLKEEEKKEAFCFTDKQISLLGIALFDLAGGFADTGINSANSPTMRTAVHTVIDFIKAYKAKINPNYDTQPVLHEGGLKVMKHINSGAKSVVDRFRAVKPTTPSIVNDFHQEVLSCARFAASLGEITDFDEHVRSVFFSDASNYIPTMAENMGTYVWIDGTACPRSAHIDYKSSFANYARRAEDLERQYNKRLTDKYWAKYPQEKAAAEEEVKSLNARLNAISDKKQAVELVSRLEKRRNDLKTFLEQDHTEEKMDDKDRGLLQEKDSFEKSLESANAYDDFLNKNPVVKKTGSLLNLSYNAAKDLSASGSFSGRIFILPLIFLLIGVPATIFGSEVTALLTVLGVILIIGTILITVWFLSDILKAKSSRSKGKKALNTMKPLMEKIIAAPEYDDPKKKLERMTVHLFNYLAENPEKPGLAFDVQCLYEDINERVFQAKRANAQMVSAYIAKINAIIHPEQKKA